jgi:hypothetical protein
MKKALRIILLIILAVALITALGIALIANRPGDISASCMEFYAGMDNPPAEALAWCQAGEYFAWESTLPENEDFDALNIFHICQGNHEDPTILMIHGYPTSSFDYAALAEGLRQDFYVCMLDTLATAFPISPWMDTIIQSLMMPVGWMNTFVKWLAWMNSSS